MMTGRLYIDNVDVYTKYGAYIVDDGWNDLFAFPPLKSINYNDWHEEDGIEVDLSEPKLDKREITLKFAFTSSFIGIVDFINMLANSVYHTFNCAYIDRVFTLRMTRQPSLDNIILLGKANITFIDDFPMSNYIYKSPNSTIVETYNDYGIDAKLFTDYGVRVLEGSLIQIIKASNVKANMERDIKTQNGVIYDGIANVVFKQKEVKMKCLLRASTWSEFWNNYDALLYDLIRPGERVLHVKALNKDFPFYYKSCSVDDFDTSKYLWLQVTLTIVLTRDFHITISNN